MGWGTSGAKTVTLSFTVYSTLTGTFSGAIRTGDSANYSYPFSYTINNANTWEYKTITIPGPTAGTWNTSGNGVGLDVWFSLGTGSTFKGPAGAWAAANYVAATGETSLVGTSGAAWWITGAQLEVGSKATPFDMRDYGRELMMCQRYYYQRNIVSTGADVVGSLQAYGSGAAYGKLFDLPVTMRATPLGSMSSITHFRGSTSGGNGTAAFSTGLIDYLSPTAIGTQGWSGTSGMSAGNATIITGNTTSAWIAASAEL